MEWAAWRKRRTTPRPQSLPALFQHRHQRAEACRFDLLDERKRRLAAEGLFEAGRKRPLPFLPQVIGVVTSPTGAVIRDILHRLRDRFPSRVLICRWPCREPPVRRR